jgi:hypothetical protein
VARPPARRAPGRPSAPPREKLLQRPEALARSASTRFQRVRKKRPAARLAPAAAQPRRARGQGAQGRRDSWPRTPPTRRGGCRARSRVRESPRRRQRVAHEPAQAPFVHGADRDGRLVLFDLGSFQVRGESFAEPPRLPQQEGVVEGVRELVPENDKRLPTHPAFHLAEDDQVLAECVRHGEPDEAVTKEGFELLFVGEQDNLRPKPPRVARPYCAPSPRNSRSGPRSAGSAPRPRPSSRRRCEAAHARKPCRRAAARPTSEPSCLEARLEPPRL